MTEVLEVFEILIPDAKFVNAGPFPRSSARAAVFLSLKGGKDEKDGCGSVAVCSSWLRGRV